jgi:hypothetical protein
VDDEFDRAKVQRKFFGVCIYFGVDGKSIVVVTRHM